MTDDRTIDGGSLIDGSRWRRIEDIFHTAVDEPAGSRRDGRVSELCGSDEALVAEVVALLAEDERLQPAVAPDYPHVGLRLGSYEVDALVARGGMAAVYEAHRADDQFQQRVAVKIMDLRLSDPALVAQFKAERQILAALEHPTLTRLLDGGVTGFGEPYLVMDMWRASRSTSTAIGLASISRAVSGYSPKYVQASPSRIAIWCSIAT